MKKIIWIVTIAIFACMENSCINMRSTSRTQVAANESSPTSWNEELARRLPLLGHRNWIVVTDMAYPLQSSTGITTLYAHDSYEQVLAQVKGMIDAAPHVYAHIYQDKESDYVEAPGMDKWREAVTHLLGSERTTLPHEQLIARLDTAGRLYSVVIIKTPLTIPYTTTFFELDCKYWDAARQAQLDKKMGR